MKALLTVRVATIAISFLIVAQPARGDGPSVHFVCPAVHYIRLGLEIGTTAITFRNADLENAATIQRLTFRDSAGNVVWDSGPAIGVEHPLNTDYVPARDFTNQPAGRQLLHRHQPSVGQRLSPQRRSRGQLDDGRRRVFEAWRSGSPPHHPALVAGTRDQVIE